MMLSAQPVKVRYIMNKFVNATRQMPDSLTENGAATFSTSLNYCVDLFFRVGASRGKVKEVTNLFKQALKEDEKLAVRIALWARDARGGAGERTTFRSMLLAMPERTQLALITKVVELGRWDDLGVLIDSKPDSEVAAVAAEYWKTALDNAYKALNILRKIDDMSEEECQKILDEF